MKYPQRLLGHSIRTILFSTRVGAVAKTISNPETRIWGSPFGFAVTQGSNFWLSWIMGVSVSSQASLTFLFLCYAAAVIPLSYVASMALSETKSVWIFFALNVIPAAVGGLILAPFEVSHKFSGSFASYVKLASWHPTFSVMWGTTNIVLNGLSEKFCGNSDNTELCAIIPFPSCCQCKSRLRQTCLDWIDRYPGI